MNILIVDDSKQSRFLLDHLLKTAGYPSPVHASSAFEAYEKLAYGQSGPDENIDLILMDVTMPDVSGLEACRVIQSKPAYRDIPVILVTGVTDTETIESAYEAGAFDYLTKPYNKKELLSRVRIALKLKSEAERRRSLESELEKIGNDFREYVLLSHHPEPKTGVRVFVETVSGGTFGSCVWDTISFGEDCLDFFLAETSTDKGFEATRNAAIIKWQLVKSVAHCMGQFQGNAVPPVSRILEVFWENVPTHLKKDKVEPVICYIRVDLRNKRVEWKNAVPSNLFHIRNAENRLSRLSANDPSVSRNGTGMEKQEAVFLQPGDILVMHSPGFNNVTNEKGETYVHDRLMNSIREGCKTGPRQLTRHIKKDVRQFFKTGLPPFDLVWVALEIVD